MPRSPSGIYTLPEAAFVAGTVIQSATVNSDLSDIATALTQSLATTGVSAMTGPFKAASGTVSAPSITFSGALTTGWYLSAANEITWVAAGVAGAVFNASGDVDFLFDATIAGTLAVPTLSVSTAATLAGRPITSFGVGTVAVFNQTSAPTSWTKLATLDDSAARFTTGAVSSGGSVAFSTLFARTSVDNITLSSAIVPTHDHIFTFNTSSANSPGSTTTINAMQTSGGANTLTTQSSGGGGAHNHAIDMRVNYIDFIRASKD